MMDLAAVSGHVNYSVGNRTDIGVHVIHCINNSYKDCWNQLPIHNKEAVVIHDNFGNTLTTVTGQDYIDIPSGIFAINHITIDGDRMYKQNWRDYTFHTYSTNPSGEPSDYFIYGKKIYFDRVADDEYPLKLFVIKDYTPLVLPTDRPDLPEDFEGAFLSLAVGYTWRLLNIPEKAQTWLTSGFTQLKYAVQVHRWEADDYEGGMRMVYRDGES